MSQISPFHARSLILWCFASLAAAVEPSELIDAYDVQIKPFLNTYCLECHDTDVAKGDLDLSVFITGEQAVEKSKWHIWKETAMRVHAHDMPPLPKPGATATMPSDAERDQFLTWVKNLKYLSKPDPGQGTIRRLSQVEYANTLRDLFGVDPKVANQVPRDAVGEGFSSSISPLLMEKYLMVADDILDNAIKPEQLQTTWKAGEMDLSIAGKVDPGKPDGGTRTLRGPGELMVNLSAPIPGTYTIRIRAGTEAVLGNEPTRMAVRIDNQVVGEIKITASAKSPRVYTVSTKLPEGRAKLSLLMLNPFVEKADPKKGTQPPPPPAPEPPKKDPKPDPKKDPKDPKPDPKKDPKDPKPDPKKDPKPDPKKDPKDPKPDPKKDPKDPKPDPKKDPKDQKKEPKTPEPKTPEPKKEEKPAKGPEPVEEPPSQDLRSAVIEIVEVIGPPALKQSEIQRRIFVANPSDTLSKRDAAKEIAKSFTRKAYRRPATAQEIEGLLKVFDLSDEQDEVFGLSIKLMLKAVLVSPAFLYLTPDDGSVTGKNGDVVAIGDHQIAAKLSYLFWSTMPDEELSALADAGKLRDKNVIAEQVRRLIKDPRSRTLFDGFGATWLGIQEINDMVVDEKLFPELTKEMRAAMYEETAMLFDTILREDRKITEFADNDYTFMNGPLARLYGMSDVVKGMQMTRVSLTNRNRGGVLTMPSILLTTSLPNRTSPVKRGAWVLERVIGQKLPTPPANIPDLDKQADAVGLNLRQRTERHRNDPACSGCHQNIDPIGFGLENFDVLGRWRERDDTGSLIDAVGELPGKKRFTTPAELKSLVSAQEDNMSRALVKRVLAHALCRSLTGYDEVIAEEIANEVARDGYKFQSIWIQVATSYPFLNRTITR
jgi:Protein of unknown function (DUF1592)/Protein of unknown function (DUF1588)/Protein of unknown function (DUF1587)/Protein of unknown function (DUF1595)/Protein of unknown function (DUF1585)